MNGQELLDKIVDVVLAYRPSHKKKLKELKSFRGKKATRKQKKS